MLTWTIHPPVHEELLARTPSRSLLLFVPSPLPKPYPMSSLNLWAYCKGGIWIAPCSVIHALDTTGFHVSYCPNEGNCRTNILDPWMKLFNRISNDTTGITRNYWRFNTTSNSTVLLNVQDVADIINLLILQQNSKTKELNSHNVHAQRACHFDASHLLQESQDESSSVVWRQLYVQ